ncbi:MAG: hypothetical protein NPIRA02_28860 [Nitrospirales bacterium]|nr:MAG: hypothetical protein NPIRA02_28860 [Nitrospirales bacterium]
MQTLLTKWLSLFCLISCTFLFCTTPVFAHGISFKTDFNDPTAGPGMIVEQSTISPARIFQYTENSVYATAIRDTDPESHFHLFGDGLLMAGDSEGVRFTFDGPNPTTPFDVFSVDVTELGTVDTLFTPFTGSTAGPSSLIPGTGSFTFDPNAWHGISSFTATFGNALPGETSRLVLTNLNVHQAESTPNPNPVPEPGTLGLFGIGILGLGLLRYRKQSTDRVSGRVLS